MEKELDNLHKERQGRQVSQEAHIYSPQAHKALHKCSQAPPAKNMQKRVRVRGDNSTGHWSCCSALLPPILNTHMSTETCDIPLNKHQLVLEELHSR